MQLVAYGAQDVYLTGNPQITFFKVVYRRHTNFSLEAAEQTFNGTTGFGKKVTCTIARNGDLIHNMYLRVQLPAIVDTSTVVGEESGARWVDHVGHALINSVEIEIGGQKIDKHYGEWLHIWNELTQTASKSAGYNRMIGHHYDQQTPVVGTLANTSSANVGKNVIPESTLYIPMQFWFCRNPGLALPLIALQYHEVKVNFEFRDKKDLIIATDHTRYQVEEMQAGLWVDYIYLDTDERRRFAQVTHEYLIEQLQFPGPESVSNVNANMKLNFNHPVKELIWTVRPGANTSDDSRVIGVGLQSYDIFDYGNGTGVAGEGLPVGAAGGGGGMFNGFITGKKNPVQQAQLQLNGHDRFSKRDGMYFNVVQPYQHHEAVPAVGINVYSFAMKPEEHQPSGTCNMSRIDNATLTLNLDPATFANDQGAATLNVYAVNYNVLRVMSGMGGLAYAS